MNENVKMAERVAVLATIDPVSQAAGTVATGYVSTANFHSLSAYIQTGVMGTAATLDAKLQQAQDSSGTGVKDITGKAIVQILKAAGDNKQVILEVRPEDLDTTNSFTFVRLSMTVGTAASLIQGTLYGTNPRYAPASAFNQAGVVQLI